MKAYGRARKRTNRRDEAGFGQSRSALRPIHPVMRAARSLWPLKAAHELRARTGRSLRTCEFWLAGRYRPDGEAIVALLRSDVGDVVLAALMEGAASPWWRMHCRQTQLAEVRLNHGRTRRLLERLERETADAALALAEPDIGILRGRRRAADG